MPRRDMYAMFFGSDTPKNKNKNQLMHQVLECRFQAANLPLWSVQGWELHNQQIYS